MLTGKKTMIATISVASILIAAAFSYLIISKSGPNIAHVENARVMAEYIAVKEASEEYNKRVEQWDANLDTLKSEIDRELLALNYENGLSIDEKNRRYELIEQKKRNYFQYKEAIEEKKVTENQRIYESLMNQIDSYLLEFGEKSQFDFILGISGEGNLLYARKSSNITEEIIQGLNEKYQGK